MRGLWKSLTWVLLLITVEPIRAQSLKRKLGSNKWDRIHEAIQGQKRAASECPTDYQLCPQSLNGGCCPSDRSCGSSSCYPTTTTTTTACGISGYIGCGIDEGGGCCPSSYSCYKNGCSPLPGVTYSETCGANSYLCPASLNYGCCKVGLACGLDNCYSTDITTFTLTETFTTTSNSETYTYTNTVVTAAGPQAPTVTATTSYAPSVLPKVGVSATPIPKTAASSTPTNGLTTPEIGGIIGGAIALLLVVLIATCIILRRLNIAIKTSESAKSKRSKSSTGQSHTHQTKKSHTKKSRDTIDFDTMSNDPFLMSPSEDGDPLSKRRVSHPPTVYSPELDSTEISPPFISPFSPRSPPSSHNRSPRGYQAIPNSDSRNSGQGYFDIPSHEDLRDQNLRFGRRPSQHSKNYSDASDQSQQRRPSQHTRNLSEVSDQSQRSRGSSTLAELDAGPDGDRRRSFQSALQSFGMNVFRRKSEPPGTVALTYREEPLDYIDEQREPLGGFKDVPLTEISNAQLRHGSVHGAGVSFSQLPGFPEAGPSKEQREDT